MACLYRRKITSPSHQASLKIIKNKLQMYIIPLQKNGSIHNNYFALETQALSLNKNKLYPRIGCLHKGSNSVADKL